ncbi:hypothetical protein [Lysobacter silvisoli]|uniref:Alpha/beta hydrolase n=1 Tax=Lysobacter silvisoli TaxID=2293254 RepID=A0A371JWI5_9GAMM|nr:hypothetical protein [Lysobacter silvisoli]RDZ25947.1 hypothetical protein DX914_18965 [Lysobacter silvisoli]
MATLQQLWSMIWPGLASALALALLWMALRLIAGWLVRPARTEHRLERGSAETADTLVVAVHGLPGVARFSGALDLIARTLPEADRLIFDYKTGGARGYASNARAAAVADAIERGIHEQFKRGQYRRVILFGYSGGASLLRKALVWGYGEDEDRAPFGRKHARRPWVEKTERMVLLAGINRGWSVEPRPALMPWPTYLFIRIAKPIGRVLGIGRFVFDMHRGSAFIADTRLQWVKLARSEDVVQGRLHFPQVIQLIGSEDDLVSKEDGQDLSVSAGTVFKTLPETSHADIGGMLSEGGGAVVEQRRQAITAALLGDVQALEPDWIEFKEDRQVTRLVYVMHGIRDLGEWTDKVRDEVRRRYESSGEKVAVFSSKYGWFPMARFLLPFDRQRNVRDFMDRYTEHTARFPNARSMDYVGHSNGTYILGSALLRYATMKVRRVFFAGSVMPYSYPWAELVDAQRVESVVNVVATRDWVVAIFPKVFQQLSALFRLDNRQGLLDLGGAGFDGFADSGLTAAVDNLQYSRGAHSTGVAVDDPQKLAAIGAYIVEGERTGLQTFEAAKRKNAVLAVVSALCAFVWLGLLAGLSILGYQIFLMPALPLLGLLAVIAYVLAVILVLYWV